MVIAKQTKKRAIRLGIALICIAALVMAATASTGRTAPGNVQPVVVNASPPAPQVIQPAVDRIVVVTTTPVPERVVVVATVTTVPVVNEPRVIPVVTTTTARPTPVAVIGQVRVVNTSPGTTGTAPGSKVVPGQNRQVTAVNPAELTQKGLQETTTGVKDPKTGEVLSPDKGAGLPGADTGTKMPSAEDQWNNRFGNAGAGDVLGGTPFDDNPLSNPMDDFLSQHGGNIPDPLAAYGSGSPDFSPKEGSSGDATVIKNEDGSTSMLVETGNSGGENQNREFVLIDFDANGNYKTDADRQMGNEVFGKQDYDMSCGTTSLLIARGSTNPVPPGSHDQQYEGEGSYTGGSGHSANDLTVGSTGRMTGNVAGGKDPGEAGLGKDTGGKTPKVFEAIAKYVAAGGKVRGGKGGYQPGDSGQGGDIGGASESRISGLKNALGSQRFIIDPDATYAEEVPWWMEKVVSPTGVAGAAQANAVPAAAAGDAGTGKAQSH